MDKSMHLSIYILITLLFGFIVFPVDIPTAVTPYVSHILGQILIMTIAASLIFYHPVLGIIAFVAGYFLIQRSSRPDTPLSDFSLQPNTETKKNTNMKKENQQSKWHQKTLEEEIIAQKVVDVETPLNQATYKPVLDDNHNTAELNSV